MEAAAATGSKGAAEELEEDYPSICQHVWQMFLALSRTRSGNGFGLNPITYLEMDAYDRLMQLHLSPEEIYLLRVADETALEQIAENMEAEKGLT